jgi:hypothetical protein
MTTLHHDAWQGEPLTVIVTHDNPMELAQASTHITVTSEGLILDFYQDGELNGTAGMTFEEWFDWVVSRQK